MTKFEYYMDIVDKHGVDLTIRLLLKVIDELNEKIDVELRK